MRKVFFMVVALLFVSRLSFAALTTYELVGTVANQNHQAVVADVKSALESAGFKVITSYNPGELKDLTVLIVKSDEFFGAVNKAGRYAFYAIPLRVGVQKTKDGNSIMFTNPVYLVDAFAPGKNSLESAAEKVKGELENALKKVKGIKVEKKEFGFKTDPEEIGDWQMMGESIYTIYEIGHKYGSIDAALKALDDSLSKGTNGWKKVYEIKLEKAAVVGVANVGYEKEAFEIGGYNHLCAFPIELVIYDNGKIKALPEMYRMSLYFMDAGMSAFAAHASMPGEIDNSLKGLLK